jgi:hypothetical protein
MRYVAELFYLEDSEHRSIDTTDIEADNDLQAGHRAQEWAVPRLAETIDRVAHLQVAIGGRSAFSKKFGDF